MMRIVPSGNAAAVWSYYTSALRREDYYMRGQEVPGKWHGKAAEYLGLKGEVTPEQFRALLENTHPLDGSRLTPRTRADRLCGWDINFHCPKSVSLLLAFTGDERLIRAFRESVAETMQDIEAMAMTRVRTDGQYTDRVSGNMVWSEFLHSMARPVDGIPDPHTHIHAFVQNVTFDSVEGRWKALKIREIKKQAPYFQALFHSRFAKKVVDLGFSARRTRHAWEVVGLPNDLLTKFSRRTAEIDALAEKKGITNAKFKDQLGAKSRAGKRRGLTHSDLMAAWGERLDDDERVAIYKTHDEKPKPSKPIRATAESALAFAEKKCFERVSVVSRNTLLKEALRYGVGYVTEAEIEQEMLRGGYFEREIGGEVLTTNSALVIEEAELIERVREGRGRLAPLMSGRLRFQRGFLSKEQKDVVRHVLKSNDQVVMVRGVAGAGKTTAMEEIRDQLEGAGIRIFAFAQSAGASRGVLRDSGFRDADTISRLLVDKRLQQSTRGGVIFIDESGIVGLRDMTRIMEIAGESTKVVLAGDPKQHTPVSRGDSMRLLEEYAGLPIASIRQIRRQEELGYREAIKALSEGDSKKGLYLLERIGAIEEVENDKARYRRLAEEYFRSMEENGELPKVMSPTHKEGRMVTRAIRDKLWEHGHLGAERPFLQYRSLGEDEADKLLPESYSRGLLLQYHQNAKGITRGDMLPVVEADGENVWLGLPNGSRLELDFSTIDRFQVYEKAKIKLAEGDLIRFTRNGTSANGSRLYNGTVRRISKIGSDGELTLENGMRLAADHGHIDHGYCRTSHSSQGKTVREVLVAQSSSSAAAASKEGFYVSCSRGKESIRIFTDDRIELQSAIGNSSQRMSALEFGGIEREIFMNEGLNGVQWAKRLAEERARHHKPGTHAQKLAASRRLDPLKKPQTMDFRDYVRMRRNNLEADGKSRSKGHGPSKTKARFRGTTVPKLIERNLSQKKRFGRITPEEDLAKRRAQEAKWKAEEKKGFRSRLFGRIQTSKLRLKQKLQSSLPKRNVNADKEKKFSLGNLKASVKALSSKAAKKMNAAKEVKKQRDKKADQKIRQAKVQTVTIRKK